MRHPFSVATLPLASVFLLSALDMAVVDMFDQVVHVALVARVATVPVTNCYLVLEVFFIQSGIEWRKRDIA